MLGTHALPKASHLRNAMFKAIKLISYDIQRNCISSFENLHVIHVFMREYSVDILRKMALTPGLLDTVSQQRHWC